MTFYFDEEAQRLKGHAMSEKRLLYFYVANEAMFKTKDKGLDYVKAFGDVMSDWIEIFTGSTCEDFYVLEALVRVIQIWEDEFIFAKSFTEVLKSFLRPKMEIARQKLGNKNMTNPLM